MPDNLPCSVDVIYVAASACDARFTRICIASIRHFYPDAPIRLLVGGKLEPGLAEELARNWNVQPAAIPAGEWGWGFVKLEPLFGPAGERFLVLDSDTAFAGPVLDAWANCPADFLVDDELQSEADTHRLYYDWRRVTEIDPAALPPQFVFNSGQWFGTSGVLRREDFAAFIDWSHMPPKLRQAGIFMPGDQGILNYVLNQKMQLEGLKVERRKIMHWPGHGMEGLDAASVEFGRAPSRIVHWAGFKGGRLGSFPGADLLRYFEAKFYGQTKGGNLKRVWRGMCHQVPICLAQVCRKNFTQTSERKDLKR
jgi:hypothetical protein